MKLKNVFGKEKNVIIGMVHLFPSIEQLKKVHGEEFSEKELDHFAEYGSVKISESWIKQIEDEVIGHALVDAKTLASVGVDGLIVENYDFGYIVLSEEESKEGLIIPYKTHKPVQDLLFNMVKELQKEVNIPLGANVLTNNPEATYEIAGEAGCQFIQLDSIIGKYKGRKEFPVKKLAELKNYYPELIVFGGVHPKYYETIFPGSLKEDEKEDWLKKDLLNLISKVEQYNLADVIVLTGDKTGGEPPKNLEFAKQHKPNLEYIAGSGIKTDSVCDILQYCEGAIVGSAFKQGGVTKNNPVSYKLSKKFMDQVKSGVK